MPASAPVSMALSVEQKTDMARPYTDAIPAEKLPDYPSGLIIYLSFEELKKLGFGRGELQGGVKVTGQFNGTVMDSGSKFVNGMQQFTASIQIQDLSLSRGEEQNRASALFGSTQKTE